MGAFEQVPAHVPHLRRIVAEQEGVVNRRQLLAAGLPAQYGRDRVLARRWLRLHPGVYLTHTGRPSYLSRCWAAFLATPAPAVLSGAAAAYLDHLIAQEPQEVQILVPESHRVRTTLSGVQVLRTRRLIDFQGTPPRTVIARTALDLAERAECEDDVVGFITAAARRQRTTARLRKELAKRPRVRHRALIEDLLSPEAEGLESPLERRFDRRVLRAHGLPRLERQASGEVDGRQIRTDARSARYATRIELDGRVHRETASSDAWRDNAQALAHDGVTLRYHWSHVVGRPCDVAAQVAAALRRGGWTGAPRRCGPACTVAAP